MQLVTLMLAYFTQNNVIVCLQLNWVALSFISRNTTFLLLCSSALSFREQRCFGHELRFLELYSTSNSFCLFPVRKQIFPFFNQRRCWLWRDCGPVLWWSYHHLNCELADHCLENFLSVCQRVHDPQQRAAQGSACQSSWLSRGGYGDCGSVVIWPGEELSKRAALDLGRLLDLASFLSFYGQRSSRSASQTGTLSISCLACTFSSNSVFLTSSLLVSASSPAWHWVGQWSEPAFGLCVAVSTKHDSGVYHISEVSLAHEDVVQEVPVFWAWVLPVPIESGILLE